MTAKKKMLCGVILLLGSCNDTEKTSAAANYDSANVVKTVEADTISSGCYSQIVQRDTALLQVENNKGNITGTLSYNIFQKDRNDGSLQGDLTDGVLKGWYLFKAEGVMSVREVAWKIKGNKLWPGVGEMVEQRDTMKFANPEALKFDSTRPFIKVPCIL